MAKEYKILPKFTEICMKKDVFEREHPLMDSIMPLQHLEYSCPWFRIRYLFINYQQFKVTPALQKVTYELYLQMLHHPGSQVIAIQVLGINASLHLWSVAASHGHIIVIYNIMAKSTQWRSWIWLTTAIKIIIKWDLTPLTTTVTYHRNSGLNFSCKLRTTSSSNFYYVGFDFSLIFSHVFGTEKLKEPTLFRTREQNRVQEWKV